MNIELHFAVSATLLFLISVISLYNISTKNVLASKSIITYILELITLGFVISFVFRFSIYKHICILTNIGYNLLNMTFLGLVFSFIVGVVFRLKLLFSILTPIFLIIYIIGFIKSLNILPTKVAGYTIITYIHIIFFTGGIIFNLLSFVFFTLEKYLYESLRKKIWRGVVYIPESMEKIGKLGFIFLIITFLMFGLGFLSGIYRIIETKKFQYLVDPLSVGGVLAGILLFLTYIFKTCEIKWISNLASTFSSNIVMGISYIITLYLNLGIHH